MGQVSHLSPSVFLCFPCISMLSSRLSPLQSGFRRQSPWCLQAGWLPFLSDGWEHTGGSQRLMEGHEEKIHLAQDIKCTWLLTFVLSTFPLPVWRSCPFQESEPFVTSPTHPPHFHTDIELPLWFWLDAVNAIGIF